MISQQPRKHTLDVLNRLHQAQKHSLLPRLIELKVFVDWALAHEMRLVRRMIEDQARHDEWLAQAAEACDGVLLPASPDPSSASLHYVDLRCLLPRVISSVERLVAAYGQAVQQSDSLTPLAAETVARIYHRNQSQLEQLKAIQARLEPGPKA